MKKEEIIEEIENLNYKEYLEISMNLIDNVSVVLFNNGHIKESNSLITACLIIKEVLESEEIKKDV